MEKVGCSHCGNIVACQGEIVAADDDGYSSDGPVHSRRAHERKKAISAEDLSPTKKQLTTRTKKRKGHASPTSSANSVVGENNVQAGHKDAKQFKSKGLDHYDILVELCEGTSATGAFVGYPSTLGCPTAEAEREIMRQGKPIRMADQMLMDSRGKRKSDGTADQFSITDCITALDEIASCFDEEKYYKAYDMLAFGPPNGRQGFMGLSTERRIGWVERLK
ncbi:hypothetical protein RHGRI_023561 [Rhododendron griersonianum]|uniref:Uncharacterized protein n=1 Tax=Rhododendron griersonianum TaxID=479676 RepID=A0AAV6J7T5_9ERIC|nr:hypothetical protein RHGRI_023561 [Rhododendron griersonianum]